MIRVDDLFLDSIAILVQIPLEGLYGVMLREILDHNREITRSRVFDVLLVFDSSFGEAFEHKEHIPEYNHDDSQPDLDYIVFGVLVRWVQ